MPSSYYDLHGDTFFQQTVNIDMEALRRRFLAHLKAGAEILDAGCGSGRDALAFGRAGYSVTAFDASAEMAMLAAAHTGIPVLQLNFEQMAWKEAFDGVWACASLLHVAVLTCRRRSSGSPRRFAGAACSTRPLS